MFWLFAQMFVLCGFAFLAGAVLTWLPLRATIRSLRAELTLTRPTQRPALPAATARPAATVVIPRQPEPKQEAEPERDVRPERDVKPEPESALEVAPEADLVPAAAPEIVPESVESAVVVVKGSSKSMIFHTPDSPYFKRMKGDVTFRSIAEAEEAGYTQWRPKTATAQAR
ncbi:MULTISPECIES: sunset domain-containing protein [unclassified Saccharothrix]|uniref:sunset domain-containing protein n=1 Tax=unclassified Saccharothrix TaxID=2593673 RepID=UPI00307F0217